MATQSRLDVRGAKTHERRNRNAQKRRHGLRGERLHDGSRAADFPRACPGRGHFFGPPLFARLLVAGAAPFRCGGKCSSETITTPPPATVRRTTPPPVAPSTQPRRRHWRRPRSTPSRWWRDWKSFQKAAKRGEPVRIELTAREINGLIAAPRWARESLCFDQQRRGPRAGEHATGKRPRLGRPLFEWRPDCGVIPGWRPGQGPRFQHPCEWSPVLECVSRSKLLRLSLAPHRRRGLAEHSSASAPSGSRIIGRSANRAECAGYSMISRTKTFSWPSDCLRTSVIS